MEDKIKMVLAASKMWNFRKENPYASDEEILKYISDYVHSLDIKDQKTKIGMIAAASKALAISKKNRYMTEKQMLRDFMREIPAISESISEKE